MKNRLKVIFAERKIKQTEFSELVGINNSTLSLIVAKEDHSPTLKVAMKIAKALDLKVEDIWSLDE
ncbi:transcriptional regulator [Bacillus sp. AFS001701]|uniref:helix-turn-helix transcriptional regulator n=1 Tax=Bacillus sp. AFS001701 TaxID=2033480 RepID=UPI000BF26742|nr:helix-turn-helix domain-containing protein [Bacillus sp. AFS001701]PET77562.1 transcriptional regulator [Bacillus sp. AFS001701]